MTRDELLPVLKEIEGAYTSFTLNEKTADIWFKYLGKFKRNVLEKCVTEWIIENQRPPTIADFYGRCDKLTKFGYGESSEW